VATFMPSINIAPNGDLGLTYLESSASKYLSMYLTGQKAGAAAGTLQASIVAKAGEATLRVFRASGELGAPLRTGDYSGVAIDPADGSFWAANEYTTSTPPPPPGTRGANWGTWIAQFTLGGDAATVAVASIAAASGMAAHQAASMPMFGEHAASLLGPPSAPSGPVAAVPISGTSNESAAGSTLLLSVPASIWAGTGALSADTAMAAMHADSAIDWLFNYLGNSPFHNAMAEDVIQTPVT
jgi:hypothetical protein